MHLTFNLQPADGWPPAAVECLPFTVEVNGYRLLTPPMFVKGLAVDDVIQCDVASATGMVAAWRHVATSDHSTVWLLRLARSVSLDDLAAQLRRLGCCTAVQDRLGVCAVDVPGAVAFASVEDVWANIAEGDLAVALPVLRHSVD